MRATFMPCSASGIAQPTITSPISCGSRPGTCAIATTIGWLVCGAGTSSPASKKRAAALEREAKRPEAREAKVAEEKTAGAKAPEHDKRLEKLFTRKMINDRHE